MEKVIDRDIVESEAILAALDEQRKLSLQFLVQLASLMLKLTPTERMGMMTAVASLLQALETFPQEWGADVTLAESGDRLVVTFEDPARDPLIINLEEVHEKGPN
ncbi:hypothetical protein SAMN04488498_101403 [Mesorhizobium albiziae]|uniref:Uncharacterized protein n=1 Tax=Neomesorhizobium albiziae TaxID=335020 RepID=A0A1I3VEZ1_9HYPH|nr:hypothetical protein [Mesorhizobium albiziae]GLS28861.1 hypothetical protein GCM10007937_05680 [Mesorhizobium albiziae]SFJ93742.1 hypothetical protein SAMN04488498_101403 [Mesorhizobium albiziae]